jgi:hypothetical protein
VKAIRIYFEGDKRLRPGFRRFLSEIYNLAKTDGCLIEPPIAAGGRDSVVKDYMDALRTHPEAWNILILDSDASDNGRLFDTLSSHSDWHPPGRIARPLRESVFWMVQIMESWFLADIPTLKDYFGKGFRESAIRKSADVEIIPKREVYRRLDEAAKATKKGAYSRSKLENAAELLRRTQPDRVKKLSRNCRRIFDTVTGKLSM